MIEQVTGHTFEYDKIHKALKIIADLPETGLPPAGPGGAAALEADAPGSGAPAGASPSPHAPSHSTSRRGSPPSPICRLFSPYLGCAVTSRLGSRRRGRLGGRTLGL